MYAVRGVQSSLTDVVIMVAVRMLNTDVSFIAPPSAAGMVAPLCHPGHPAEPCVLVGRCGGAARMAAAQDAPVARPLRLRGRQAMDQQARAGDGLASVSSAG